MNKEERAELVRSFRAKTIEGVSLKLVPYEPGFAKQVIRLRNEERVRYYLNQAEKLTLSAQQRWYEEVYLPRENDIQWVILSNAGDVVGTNALYDIDLKHGSSGEKGRQVVDERVSLTAPFALESDYLICKLAFESFKLKKLLICYREDNVKVASMNKRIGFSFVEVKELRGVPYIYSECLRENFQEDYLGGILRSWRRRYEKS